MIISVAVKKLTTPIDYTLALFNQPKDGIEAYSIYINQTEKQINLKINYDRLYSLQAAEPNVFIELIKRIKQHHPEAAEQVSHECINWYASDFTLSLVEYWCPYMEELVEKRIEIDLLRED